VFAYRARHQLIRLLSWFSETPPIAYLVSILKETTISHLPVPFCCIISVNSLVNNEKCFMFADNEHRTVYLNREFVVLIRRSEGMHPIHFLVCLIIAKNNDNLF
jgi:hypothetical protein